MPSPPSFIVIGENIHTTRVLTRKNPRVVTAADGREGVTYGEGGFLHIPDAAKRSQDYEEGRIKHVKIAVQAAMDGDPGRASMGQAYLRHLILLQEQAGAAFLDLNVDEISIKSASQIAAMVWLAKFTQSVSRLPLSIDSSSMEVIEAGMALCDRDRELPLLNSASLERKEALDLARNTGARVVVTAAGGRGMPAGAADRVSNASLMVEAALGKDIAISDIFIDPLIFPISVDKEFALHSLDAMRQLRARFGPGIHITGGFSNVSFGIPHRSAINDVFLRLAVAAGADSGIIDPVANPPARAQELDPGVKLFQMAEAVLLGQDEHCRNYIKAWRKGEI